MTIKALLNFGGFHEEPTVPTYHTHQHYGIMDRYHGDYHEHHGWHGSRGKGGGGGGGAALSALTLLAFLFLINVMQQSLMENNATETTTMAPGTIFLRDDQQPISLTSRFDKDDSIEKDSTEDLDRKEERKEISYVKIKSSN